MSAIAVFHIVSATLDPKHSSEFADRSTTVLQNVVDKLEGFLEGRVFRGDDGKTVIIITAWKSRHLWAEAEWTQQVQALLADYAESGATFADAMCYAGPAIVAPGGVIGHE